MLRLIMVTGESLSPIYQEGDYVLIVTSPFFIRRVKAGDIVVFKHGSYGTLIKRVDHIDTLHEKIFVIGTTSHSLDSRSFGPIKQADITGKVIWHIPRRRG